MICNDGEDDEDDDDPYIATDYRQKLLNAHRAQRVLAHTPSHLPTHPQMHTGDSSKYSILKISQPFGLSYVCERIFKM